jgi:hypothetical protein
MAVQERKSKAAKIAKWLLFGGLVVFAVLQVLPLGRDHTNPPITGEPVWISRNSEMIARTSCYDCHSNETRWPWYTDVIPWSWLTENDVENGRAQLNFSEWDKPQPGLADAVDTLQGDSMPPWRYLLIHPEARLDSDEKAELTRALRFMQRVAPADGG